MRVVEGIVTDEDPDAVAHWNRLSSPVAGQYAALQNLVKEIKAGDAWQYLTGLCVCGNTAADSMLNIIDSTKDCVNAGGGTSTMAASGAMNVGGTAGLLWDAAPDDLVSYNDGGAYLYNRTSVTISDFHTLLGWWNATTGRRSGIYFNGQRYSRWYDSNFFGGPDATINANSLAYTVCTGSAAIARLSVTYSASFVGNITHDDDLTQFGIYGMSLLTAGVPGIAPIPPATELYAWWIGGKELSTLAKSTSVIQPAIDNYNTAMGIT